MIGQPYDADTYNCVDFAWEVLRGAGLPVPEIADVKTVPGFFRALRRHWQPAAWPPQQYDLVVMVAMGRWHLGVWRDHRVWHCDGQAQATDYGTIKAMYRRVEFYRHVQVDHQGL